LPRAQQGSFRPRTGCVPVAASRLSGESPSACHGCAPARVSSRPRGQGIVPSPPSSVGAPSQQGVHEARTDDISMFVRMSPGMAALWATTWTVHVNAGVAPPYSRPCRLRAAVKGVAGASFQRVIAAARKGVVEARTRRAARCRQRIAFCMPAGLCLPLVRFTSTPALLRINPQCRAEPPSRLSARPRRSCVIAQAAQQGVAVPGRMSPRRAVKSVWPAVPEKCHCASNR
jgi:hypothetical protein